MIAELAALGAAFSFGLSSVLTRKGLGHGSVLQALTVTLGINCLILWTLGVLLVPRELFRSPGLLWFVLAGLFAPGLGRMFNYWGIHFLGASRSAPVVATAPLFAAFAARWLLAERLTASILGGTLLIVLGVIALSLRRAERTSRRHHFGLPLAAACFYGLSFPLNKIGLTAVPNEILGSSTTTTTSFALLLAYLAARRGRSSLRLSGQAWLWFSLAGASTSAAFLLSLLALRRGTVTIATPLITAYPLFTVVLSRLFLRQEEEVGWNVWAGAAIIIAGAAWISRS